MALAHEPDFEGFVREHEPLLVPRWSEAPSATFTAMVRPCPVVSLPLDRPVSRRQWLESSQTSRHAIKPAARSIYDMPINPLPAPSVNGFGDAARLTGQPGAVVLPFVRPSEAPLRVSPIDYRPLWVTGAFLAASLCAATTVGASWFQVAPAQATSTFQRIASQTNALIGVTGVASIAAVVSAAMLFIGAQRN